MFLIRLISTHFRVDEQQSRNIESWAEIVILTFPTNIFSSSARMMRSLPRFVRFVKFNHSHQNESHRSSRQDVVVFTFTCLQFTANILLLYYDSLL